MRHLALFTALVASTCSAPKPPGQVQEPLPTVSDAPSSSPKAVPGPDMANEEGKMPEQPLGAPAEAFQPVTGTLDGKPWELKGAGTIAQVGSDGNVQIVLANYTVDCAAHTPGPGDRTITLTIPWKAKMRLDLGALNAKEASAAAMDEKKKKPAPIRGFKPKGTLDVVAAPTKLNSSGRIKIDLTSGKEDGIKAEIPVRFCFSS